MWCNCDLIQHCLGHVFVMFNDIYMSRYEIIIAILWDLFKENMSGIIVFVTVTVPVRREPVNVIQICCFPWEESTFRHESVRFRKSEKLLPLSTVISQDRALGKILWDWGACRALLTVAAWSQGLDPCCSGNMAHLTCKQKHCHHLCRAVSLPLFAFYLVLIFPESSL